MESGAIKKAWVTPELKILNMKKTEGGSVSGVPENTSGNLS